MSQGDEREDEGSFPSETVFTLEVLRTAGIGFLI